MDKLKGIRRDTNISKKTCNSIKVEENPNKIIRDNEEKEEWQVKRVRLTTEVEAQQDNKSLGEDEASRIDEKDLAPEGEVCQS